MWGTHIPKVGSISPFLWKMISAGQIDPPPVFSSSKKPSPGRVKWFPFVRREKLQFLAWTRENLLFSSWYRRMIYLKYQNHVLAICTTFMNTLNPSGCFCWWYNAYHGIKAITCVTSKVDTKFLHENQKRIAWLCDQGPTPGGVLYFTGEIL